MQTPIVVSADDPAFPLVHRILQLSEDQRRGLSAFLGLAASPEEMQQTTQAVGVQLK